MMPQTIQQQRAKYALDCVQEAAKDKAIHKEYKSYASNLPAMIHMNGLGQAAAFFKSKSDTHRKLYDLLSDWLCCHNQPYAGCANLLEGITTKDMHHYRLAQAEAQALMDWVKKFAKAFMITEEDAQ
jgi:CRISPR-associated protein Cmr5